MADDQNLDDALASMGLDMKPATREDELYLHLTEGKYPKISNCRYWMIGEMAKFKYIKEKDIKITKDKVINGQLQSIMLSNTEYAKIVISYFLIMYHLPYFQPLNDAPAASMSNMVDRLIEYPDIKEIIDKYGG